MRDGDLRASLRKNARAARRELDADARQTATAKLVHRLESVVSLLAAECVGGYLADDGEPDISASLSSLAAAGATVALPVVTSQCQRTDDGNRTGDGEVDADGMEFAPWRPGDPMGVGRFGIRVPATDARVVPTVALVPLVAFDRDLNRLGRGGGFYDRWLADRACLVVGVAFEHQRVPSFTPATHDVPLDVLVTDLGLRWR